jgi:hypothetical protein
LTGAARAGAVVLAVAGGLAVPVGLLSTATAGRLPVKLEVRSTSQADLLAANRLSLRLRLRSGGRVKIQTVLRRAHKPSVALGHTRTVSLAAGRARVVAVPLRAVGRAALARCPLARVVVTIKDLGGIARPRSFTRALRLDPPQCRRYFSRRAVWNAALADDAALDPQSGAVTGELLRQVNDGFAAGPPPTINTNAYTPTVYTVASSTPRVRVALDRPPGYARDLAAAFASVPLPAGARPSPGSDGELVVWQPATGTLWEFWRLRRAADGWHATWGGRMRHVTDSPGAFTEPHADWGTSASSLPLVGGLITPSELGAGKIDHAVALGIPRARAGVFALPAQRTDGNLRCAHAVPEGAHFRLDPGLDIAALRLPPATATLARAAQRYGIVVREQSGAVAFYAQNAASLQGDPYPRLFGGQSPTDLLRSFPWSRLQLVKMRLVKMPGQGPQLPGPADLQSGCR